MCCNYLFRIYCSPQNVCVRGWKFEGAHVVPGCMRTWATLQDKGMCAEQGHLYVNFWSTLCMVIKLLKENCT